MVKLNTDGTGRHGGKGQFGHTGKSIEFQKVKPVVAIEYKIDSGQTIIAQNIVRFNRRLTDGLSNLLVNLCRDDLVGLPLGILRLVIIKLVCGPNFDQRESLTVKNGGCNLSSFNIFFNQDVPGFFKTFLEGLE